MAVIPAFDEIPLDWRVPGADLEIRPTYTEAGLFDYPARGLIIAPMLSTGTAEAGRLYRVTRPSDGIALCGAGSIGAAMIEAARTANRSSDLWMVAIPDAAGATAATGKISFGNALGAGALAVYIGGRRVRIVLTTSMTAPQRAAALVAAINADTAMPVAAAQGTDAATHEVLLTARHGGETGNDILIRLGLQADEVLPAGAQVTVTAMSGGAGDPDVQDAIDAINEQKFDAIALPWTGDANLTVLAEELRQRYTAMARLDGHGYAGLRGTFGQLTTKGTVTNSPHLTLIGADASPTPPWIWGRDPDGCVDFPFDAGPCAPAAHAAAARRHRAGPGEPVLGDRAGSAAALRDLDIHGWHGPLGLSEPCDHHIPADGPRHGGQRLAGHQCPRDPVADPLRLARDDAAHLSAP
ncbi:hypothetical protein V6L77_00625 [Pannonibacter sp. Pt2-lr]